FDVDGMRADLVIARAALAHAAWRGAGAVAEEDVRVAARLALPHRRRRDPFDEPGIDDGALDDALRDAAAEADGPGDPGPDGPGPDGPGPDGPDGSGPDDPDPDGPGPEGPSPDGSGPDGPGPDGPGPGGTPATNGTSVPKERTDVPSVAGSAAGEGAAGEGAAMPAPAPGRARRLVVPGIGEGAPGRRSRARTGTGRVVRPSGARPERVADVHLPATIAAAAPEQGRRGRTGPGLLLHRADLRHAVREGREGNLVLFAVDASGSMAARARMAAVAGAVLALLRDAYQRRDKVGLVAFRGRDAQLVLPPTSSVPAAQVRLAAMRTGGRTPLAAGLLRARDVLRVERLRDPRRRPLLVLLTDGRATVGVSGDPVRDACRAAALLAADGVATVVVDCESGPVRLGLAARLAAAAGGDLLGLDALTAEAVTDVVRAARAA
ncbi:MAG: VWA domain-containing protein, partial [Pseudonocardiales bacterium]|nr:VWA domain-containing protein [Pseudonocardiales bacterium]